MEALVRSPGGRNGTRHVLIVDDEPSIRLICNINLTSSGWRCAEAVDGEQAIEIIRRDPPDIVLLDAMMPTLDGWATAEQLASDPATRDVPVVFLTAKADLRDRKRARDVGAIAFLTKPINPVTLGSILEGILERLARGEREQLRAEVLEDLGT
jgi:CheY-like chemotaxis protein